MEITLTQHYDITYLVLFLCLVLWFTIAAVGHKIYTWHQAKQKLALRRKYEHLTRYSFIHPGEK